jgi:hypothetical protein
MEKLIKLVPIIAFLAFLVKTIHTPPSIADALILFALVSYIVAEQMRLSFKQTREYDKKLAQFVQEHEKQTLELKTLQGHVNSIKLGVGLRQVQSNSKT